jgi:Ca2+-binding RTX toxin-like protein
MATITGTGGNDTIDEASYLGSNPFEGNQIDGLGGNDLIIALRKQTDDTVIEGNVLGPNAFITDTVNGGEGVDRYRVTAQESWTASVTTYLERQGFGEWTANLVSIESLHIIALTHGTALLGDGDDIIDARNAAGGFTPNYDLGGGNDTFLVSRGTVPVEMGAGSDRLVLDQSYNNARTYLSVPLSGDFASGYSGTYRRSDGATSYADISFAGVEHFTITTAGGIDMIVTGDGDDVVSTGGGNDLITAGRGANVIDGGSETDALSIDLSNEGAGVTIDLLAAGAQQTGGTGSVTGIESFTGAVVGTAHGDMFREGNYAFGATFDTGAGNDIVQVSRGADTANMGGGNDRLVVDYSHSNGHFYGENEPFTGTFAEGYSGQVYLGGGAAQTTFSGVEHFTITSAGGNDAVVVGDGNDIISTGLGSDRVTAGKGANDLDGGDGIDRLSVDYSARAAAITLDLLLVGAQQSGGPGSVTNFESFEGAVTGTGFGDIFREGNHGYGAQFATGAGDDLVQVSRGIDTVAMESGSDRLVVDYSHSNGHFYGLDEPFTGTFAGGYSGQFYLGGGSAQTTFSGVEHFTITSAGGNDAIVVGDGDDVISTGLGSDRVTAGRGVNDLNGGDGIDRLGIDFTGRASGVSLNLLVAGAQLASGPGSVTGFESFEGAVTGTRFNDIFREGVHGYGAQFSTGAGNDLVQVSSGTDTVNMGGGSDRLVVDWSHSNGRFYGENEPFTGSLATGYSGQFYLGGGSAKTTFSGVEHFTISIGSTNDTVKVGDGNDVISSGLGADTVTAAGGNDVVDGGGGIDKLSGGDGNDVLAGGEGNDILDGGAGADRMSGGIGDDSYAVDLGTDRATEAVGEGIDTVTSQVDFRLGANVEHLVLGGTARSGTGNGLDNNLTGNAAANVLNGAGGADRLAGGAEDDLYYVDTAGDVIVEASGAGTDSVRSVAT